MKPPNPSKGESITICVDPRIELIGMVFAQTSWESEVYSWGTYDHRNYTYFQDIQHLLSPHLQHPAIIIAENLVTEHRFIWDAIPNYILFHGNPPRLDLLRPYDAYIVGRAGSEIILHDFADALRDLMKAIDFEGFYTAHGEFYQTLVLDVKKKFQGQKLIHTLTSFFGWNLASYQVILAPGMYPGGGNGLRIPVNGNFHSYEIIRVRGVKDGKPRFGNSASIYDLALHEFAHTYVNPIAEQYATEVNALKPLYQHIESRLTQNVTRDWLIKFCEQVIHAFQLFVQQETIDQDQMEQKIAECERVGLYMTRKLVDLYTKYTRARQQYPTFDHFFPEIIALYQSDARNADIP